MGSLITTPFPAAHSQQDLPKFASRGLNEVADSVLASFSISLIDWVLSAGMIVGLVSLIDLSKACLIALGPNFYLSCLSWPRGVDLVLVRFSPLRWRYFRSVPNSQ